VLATAFLAAAISSCGPDAERTDSAEAAGEGALRGEPVSGQAAGPRRLIGLWLPRGEGSSLAPCGEDRVLEVEATHGDELGRAVRLARPGAPPPVRVTVLGSVESTPDRPATATLRLDEVVEVHASSACPGEGVDRPLTGPAWQLTGLPDSRSEVPAAGAWLRLREEPPVVEGFTGCGPLSGRYDWEVTRLRFGGLDAGAATCPSAPVHEGFLEALAATGSYRIRGDTLDLLGEAGPVARFRAAGGSGALPPAMRPGSTRAGRAPWASR
jgi:heat shock protein HslJ